MKKKILLLIVFYLFFSLLSNCVSLFLFQWINERRLSKMIKQLREDFQEELLLDDLKNQISEIEKKAETLIEVYK